MQRHIASIELCLGHGLAGQVYFDDDEDKEVDDDEDVKVIQMLKVIKMLVTMKMMMMKLMLKVIMMRMIHLCLAFAS